MQIDARNISKSNYPLAWLIGTWEGTGQFGGHFNLESTHIKQEITFENSDKHLIYNSTMQLAGFDEDGNFKVDNDIFITESGKFSVILDIINETHKKLNDEQIFPVNAEILTKWSLPNRQNKQNELTDVWIAKYVGLIGKGKLELLADEIEVLCPDFDIANNLWRSKRLFGYIPSLNRLMWVWDIAQIGANDKENDLQSIFSAGLEKKDVL